MKNPPASTLQDRSPLRPLPGLIFASRWLQLPLYLGLIAAQAVYVFHFWVELVHCWRPHSAARKPCSS
jgi:uncharacterized membrane protein YqhA